MRENLMSGSMWQGMETRFTLPRRHSLTLPRGRRDSHRQNKLVLALSNSVSKLNPNPPAAGNASRWAGSFRANKSLKAILHE
jgi:hypothetical protein